MVYIETKYNVGDVVWRPSIKVEKQEVECPDCLGEKEWTCTTPAGESYTIPCQRCQGWGRELPKPVRHVVETSVRRLTIGSIRADTNREDNEYMCRETGVGSGTIHYESILFPTEEAAQAKADEMAEEKQKKINERPEVEHTHELNTLSYAPALAVRRARVVGDSAWRLRHLLEELHQNMEESWKHATGDDIRFELQNLLDYDEKYRGPHPLLKLLEVVNQYVYGDEDESVLEIELAEAFEPFRELLP